MLASVTASEYRVWRTTKPFLGLQTSTVHLTGCHCRFVTCCNGVLYRRWGLFEVL